MTTPAGHADPPAQTSTDAAADEHEPTTNRLRQAAGEVARSLPPMTADQAALIRRALRNQHPKH